MKLGPIPHMTPTRWVSVGDRVEVELVVDSGEWIEGQVVSDRRFLAPLDPIVIEVDGVEHRTERELLHETATVQLANGEHVDIFSMASEADHAAKAVEFHGPRWRH